MILATAASATSAINWVDLGLHPVAIDLGFFQIRWYSLAYIFGIIFAWWQLTKMVEMPGSPMAKRHVDDFIFYATLGVILGGRLGYVAFYKPDILQEPTSVFKLWEGGMSFHGGVIGVVIAILLFCRKHKLPWLRLHDYIAVVYPVGHFLGRMANFVNGELWGRETDASWGMIFPGGGDVVRHPSQLYQGALEGLVLAALMWFLFKRTDARYKPGYLVGAFILAMGAFRFFCEYFREPDEGVTGLIGLTMGQTLCVPMILGGIYLIMTANNRRAKAETSAGQQSIA